MNVKLVVVGGKQAGLEIPVVGPEFLIGRGSECRLQPRSNLVSRKHCSIVVENGTAALHDFGSTNGTLVNGERVDKRRELHNGDHINIGVLEVEVCIAGTQTPQKRPKVASVHEAAARTAAGTRSGDDLDISSWLEEAQGGAARPDEETAVQDTSEFPTADETTESLVADEAKKSKKAESGAKSSGHLPRSRKPTTDTSQDAATDTLRKFFNIR